MINQIICILEDASTLPAPKTKLGKAFNAIERVGYARTGIRAFTESQKAEDKLKNPLLNMACRVVPHQIGELTSYASIYPPVHTFLKNQAKIINTIFSIGEGPVLRSSIPEFEEAIGKWTTWCGNNLN